MAARDGTLHEDTQRYTATVDSYRLSRWETAPGRWSATVVRGRHGSARHDLPSREAAMDWCLVAVAKRAHGPPA